MLSRFDFKGKLSLTTAFYIFTFIVICALSYRQFFLDTNYSVIGHNWDWTFPGIEFVFKRMYALSAYTWYNFNLGSGLFLSISHIVPNSLVSIASYAMQIKYVVLTVLIGVNLISYIFGKRLYDYLIGYSPHNYLPALLYAFSPFLFNEIIGGSWYMWISFAFAPVYVLNLLKFVKSGNIWNLLGFLLSGIFVIASLQNFLMLEALTLGILFIHNVLTTRDLFSNQNKRYVYAHISQLIFNVYWLLPFSYSMLGFFSKVSGSEFTGNFGSHYTTTQNVWTILTLVGYFDRNMYHHVIPAAVTGLFLLTIFAFWVLTIKCVFESSSKRFQALPLYLLLFLGFGFLAKGDNPPFGELTLYIYKSLPIFSLYRSVQHTMFPLAFLVPVIMAIVLRHYVSKDYKYRYIASALFFFLVNIWCMGWWYRGDLGRSILRSKHLDHIDAYLIDSDFTEFLTKTQNNQFDNRVLFLPTVQSPIFIETEYQNAAQGGSPEYMYLENPTLSAESNSAAAIIDNYFCRNTQVNWTNVASVINIKYIILRKDLAPIHTLCGKKFLWDVGRIEKLLAEEPKIKLIDKRKYYSLYELDSAFSVPHLYIPNEFVTSAYEFSDLSKAEDIIPTAAYVAPEIMENLKLLPIERAPSISYEKVNSTQYKVSIRNASVPFVFVFSESFESGWKLFTPKMTELLSKIKGDSIITEVNHFKVNGYANAWYIDPSEICKKVQCEFGGDANGEFKFTIYYWPQILFYVGSTITLAFVGLLLMLGLVPHISSFSRIVLRKLGNK